MIRISQSAMRNFWDGTFCDIRWVHEYVRGMKSPPSDVQNRGLVFEWELIGGCRGGVRPEMRKSVAKGNFGGMLKEERDLIELAEEGKRVVEQMGFKIIDVQPEWTHDDLEAHPDAVAEFEGRNVILDVKYTETAEDDRRNGWADLDQKSNLQPVHYVHMSKEIYGEYLPFYYLIFGKAGWVRVIKIEILPMALEEHEANLEIFRSVLQDWKPQAPHNYNKCRRCPHWDHCESKTTLPNVEHHEISTVVMNS